MNYRPDHTADKPPLPPALYGYETAAGIVESVNPADQLRSQADLLQSLGNMLELVRASAEPNRTHYDFEFVQGLDSLVLPVSVYIPGGTQNGNRLGLATVSVTKEAGETHSTTISLHFDDRNICITRDSKPSLLAESSGSDWVTFTDKNHDPEAIDKISNTDIDTVLRQLLFGDKVPIFPNEHDRNILSAPHEDLIDAFQTLSSAWEAQYSFIPAAHPERLIRWGVQHIADEEMLQSIRLQYETGTPNRQMVVDIDPRLGLSLTFMIHDLENDTTYTISPDTGDYIRLQEVVRDITKANEHNSASLDALSEAALVRSGLCDSP